jgi:hypothetical protein
MENPIPHLVNPMDVLCSMLKSLESPLVVFVKFNLFVYVYTITIKKNN